MTISATATEHLAAARRPGPIVVMTFDGTSVADPDRIHRVARRLVEAHESGSRVVGVVSAMGWTTDDLIRLAHEVSPAPDPRELDMLLSVGERIACALVAMAVHDLGTEAVSLTGSQAGIITDERHGSARIVEVRTGRIDAALDRGAIVLVAGFQGMSEGRDITTLGRGGSDTTAVALATALGAGVCEVYTDSGGVFSADPRLVLGARRLATVGFEEMAELAAAGAGVLQLRSVEFARKHGITLHVRSTFENGPGTWVVEESDRRMERAAISGVTHTAEETVYRVHGAHPAELFSALADGRVHVDTIIQTSADVLVFSAPVEDRAAAASTLDRLGASWSEYDELAKVSVVGSGMKSDPGVVARVFETLRTLGVEPQFISTSPVKIAFYVPGAQVEEVVRALHGGLGLSIEPTE